MLCTGVYLNGPLNIDALKTAIRSVIDKHVGLRCTISEDGSEAILNQDAVINVPVHDLVDLPEEVQKKQADEILHKEALRFLDLNKGPLVEFQLLKLSAEKHLLIMTAQMIVCDGWSHYVVFEDLSAIYSALINNTEPRVQPSVSMQKYNDWEKSNQDSAEEKDCEEFWLSRFSSIPPPIDLPSSKLRPSVRTYNGDRRTITINKELYSDIKRLGAEQKSSSFAVLFAAFYAWLFRLSENNDLVVGVPFAAQSPLGMDRLIGQCANTLPLRLQFEPEEPFSNILKKTWNSVLDAQENWNFSYSRLISRLNIPPDPSRIPLVSILFNIDPPMDKVSFKGLEHKFVTGPRYFFQYDLGFNLVEDLKTVNVECDYNPNLFDGEMIEKWVKGYISILEIVVKEPDHPISSLPLADRETEVSSKIKSIVDDAEDINPNYIEVFKESVTKFPDNIAIKSNDESLTYLELDRRSDELGRYLISYGLENGGVAGIYLNRTSALAVALLAVIKSGAAYLLLDPETSVEQLSLLNNYAGHGYHPNRKGFT